jgi:hypothetical protein
MRRIVASLVACASLTAATSAWPQATTSNRTHIIERRNDGLVVAGGIMTALSAVFFTYAAVSVSQNRLAGPNCVPDGGGCSGGSGPWTAGSLFGLVGGATLAVIGVPVLVVGLTSKREEPVARPHVAIVPTLGGLSVSGAF